MAIVNVAEPQVGNTAPVAGTTLASDVAIQVLSLSLLADIGPQIWYSFNCEFQLSMVKLSSY